MLSDVFALPIVLNKETITGSVMFHIDSAIRRLLEYQYKSPTSIIVSHEQYRSWVGNKGTFPNFSALVSFPLIEPDDYRVVTYRGIPVYISETDFSEKKFVCKAMDECGEKAFTWVASRQGLVPCCNKHYDIIRTVDAMTRY